MNRAEREGLIEGLKELAGATAKEWGVEPKETTEWKAAAALRFLDGIAYTGEGVPWRDVRASGEWFSTAAYNEVKSRAEAAERRLAEAHEALKAFIYWGGQQCPCKDESPDPCPLCGATVAEGACKAVDEKFPASILAKARAALTPAKGTRDGG